MDLEIEGIELSCGASASPEINALRTPASYLCKMLKAYSCLKLCVNSDRHIVDIDVDRVL